MLRGERFNTLRSAVFIMSPRVREIERKTRGTNKIPATRYIDKRNRYRATKTRWPRWINDRIDESSNLLESGGWIFASTPYGKENGTVRSEANTSGLLRPQQVCQSHHGRVHLTLIARNRDCGQWMLPPLPRNDSLAPRMHRPRLSPLLLHRCAG